MQTRRQTAWRDSRAQATFPVAQNAFTLLELLVVIAILLVLASLLLPAISRVKAGAHAAKCQSNLRQIGIANTLYTSDFHSLPRFFGVNLAKSEFWPDVLVPYTSSTWLDPLYRCPGYPKTNSPAKPNRGFFIMPTGSYDMNAEGTAFDVEPLGLGWIVDGPNYRAVKESEVAAPANSIMFGDSLVFVGQIPAYSQLQFSQYSRGTRSWLTQAERIEAKRHSGLFCIVFMDGHVERLKTNRLFGRTDEVAKRWNRDDLPHRETWR